MLSLHFTQNEALKSAGGQCTISLQNLHLQGDVGELGNRAYVCQNIVFCDVVHARFNLSLNRLRVLSK